MDKPDEKENKVRYARLLLEYPKDPFKAACELFPQDTRMALWAASHWVHDPEVKEAQRKARETLVLNDNPGKAEAARDVWNRIQSCYDPEVYVKLMKLYADIMGYIEKPKDGTTVNVNTQNRIMVVKDHGSNDQWEEKLKQQQYDLTHGNAAVKH